MLPYVVGISSSSPTNARLQQANESDYRVSPGPLAELYYLRFFQDRVSCLGLQVT